MRKILIPILVLWLSGCSIYKVDVQQGNVIEPEQVAKLKVGMTKRQVYFLMGNPLLTDPFHKDRWDYLYMLTPGGGKTSRQVLTLFFDGDSLARIDTSRLEKVVLK